MTEYTIGLALEDFLPVIFSSIGLYLVSQIVGRYDSRLHQMAVIGWILVTVGGFLKASWKLTMAITQTRVDIVWMDKGMFLWMAVGFVLLAASIWYFKGREDRPAQPNQPWLVPSIILGLTLFAILSTGFPDFEVSTWRFVLLGVMTLANVFMIVLLIQIARRSQHNLAAILLVGSIIVTFALSGMARIPEQTISLQWIEQLLNTAGQGAFAYAVWVIYQTAQEAIAGQVVPA